MLPMLRTPSPLLWATFGPFWLTSPPCDVYNRQWLPGWETLADRRRSWSNKSSNRFAIQNTRKTPGTPNATNAMDPTPLTFGHFGPFWLTWLPCARLRQAWLPERVTLADRRRSWSNKSSNRFAIQNTRKTQGTPNVTNATDPTPPNF